MLYQVTHLLARAHLLPEVLVLNLVARHAEDLEGLVRVERVGDRLAALVVNVVEREVDLGKGRVDLGAEEGGASVVDERRGRGSVDVHAVHMRAWRCKNIP